MAITTADGYFGAARQIFDIQKTASFATIAANPFSLWDVAGNPGAGSLAIGNTTTGLVPTDATAGAPAITDFGSGNVGYIQTAEYANSVAGRAFIYDRLWHAGSVSMTALATTTFSSQPAITQRLPNAGTDWGGLEILLEINVAVSATATTVSVSYTNEAGVSGRTTGASASLSGFTNRRIVRLPLQAGDKGVRTIDSVTVGGTVATTGTFNVILARRLAAFNTRVANACDIRGWDLLGGPIVFQDSCLWGVVQPDSTAAGVLDFGLTIING